MTAMGDIPLNNGIIVADGDDPDTRGSLFEEIKGRVIEVSDAVWGERGTFMERLEPERAAAIIMDYATGFSKRDIIQKHKTSYTAINRIIASYAADLEAWRRVGATLERSRMLRLEDEEDKILDKLDELLQDKDWVKENINHKTLLDLQKAITERHKRASSLQGDNIQKIEVTQKTVTINDIEDLRQKALESIQPAEVIEVKEEK